MPISSCDCKNPHQDALHGPGRRVFNRFVKGNGGIRCTSCNAEKHADAKPKDDKKGKKK